MTLKINYLDRQKGFSNNTALFLGNDSKISDFKGIFDDKINQKILNYLKKSKKILLSVDIRNSGKKNISFKYE